MYKIAIKEELPMELIKINNPSYAVIINSFIACLEKKTYLRGQLKLIYARLTYFTKTIFLQK